jgi:hypothetical protein
MRQENEAGGHECRPYIALSLFVGTYCLGPNYLAARPRCANLRLTFNWIPAQMAPGSTQDH